MHMLSFPIFDGPVVAKNPCVGRFAAVIPALISDQVAGATASWNDEGAQVTREKSGYHAVNMRRSVL